MSFFSFQNQKQSPQAMFTRPMSAWVGFLVGILVLVFSLLIGLGFLPISSRIPYLETFLTHARGSLTAPVTIIEYTNFACPFCAELHTNLQTIASEYGSRVRWEFRHFPQDLIGPGGRELAQTTECIASRKGEKEFWQIVDRLFSVPVIARPQTLNDLTTEWSISQDLLDSCGLTTDIDNQINRDLREGLTRGIRGAPALVINGELIPGAIPLDQLRETINSILDSGSVSYNQ